MATAEDAASGSTAPAGFVTYEGHHYKYVKGLYTYAEARAGAAAAGGHLATITSAGENTFLASLIAGQDLGAWLGGGDFGTEGEWRWTEGPEAGALFWTGLDDGAAAPGQYTNWSVGEPNGVWNGIEEDHFHMMANSAKWNDASGYWVTMGYFIEIDGPVPPPPDNTPPVITSNGGGAAAALSVVENTAAVTIVAADDAEGDALTFAIAGGADVALFAIDAETGALSFRAAPDFEAPADANGDNVYEVEVRAGDGRTSDVQSIAVTVVDVAEPPPGGGGSTAPAGFVTYEGHHYKYVKGLYTYAEAWAGAAAAGGHLATITSAGENTFLASLIAGQDLGAWLGGGDFGTEGEWRWTEGPEAGALFWTGLDDGAAAPGQYTNWSVGEPNGVWNGIEEDHFHMMANSAKWNDASGYWVTMGYFIEIDGPVPPPPDNTPPVITSNGGGAAAALSVVENTAAVTIVAADDAEGDALTFAIAGGADVALFAIDAETGALSFRAAPDFEAPADANGDNVYEVEVRAGDGRTSDVQSIAVTVVDVAEPPPGGGGSTAPAGFVTYEGHHYKYVKGLYTYAEARAGAAAAGGHLATITSAGENTFLARLMATAGPDGYGGWLGGGDSAAEGEWRWTEGPEAGEVFWNGLGGGSAPAGAYTNWLPGEPSQYQGMEEDNLHMLTDTDLWNDITNQYWMSMGYFTEISA